MKKIRLILIGLAVFGFSLSTLPLKAGCTTYTVVSKRGTGQNAGACLTGGDDCNVTYTICGPDF